MIGSHLPVVKPGFWPARTAARRSSVCSAGVPRGAGRGSVSSSTAASGAKFSTPQLHSWVVPQRSAWMQPGSRNTSRRRTLRGAARSHGERWHSLASRIPGTGISELQIERGAKPRGAAHAGTGYL